MKRKSLFLLTVIVWFIFPVVVFAQTDANQFMVRVFVDSAFVRALPEQDAEPVGSVFEDTYLLAVGRNIDGTWFEVRRPGRVNEKKPNIGWISREVVIYTFEVADLPMTDLTTGVTGPEPVYDTGYSTFILLEAALRAEPNLDAERLAIVPIMLTLPVLDRTVDRQWVRINYRGTVGWVAEFLTRASIPLDDIPVNPAFAVSTLPVEIIPLELQLAQINRFRDYVRPILAQSEGVANFWSLVGIGEIVECNPPEGTYAQYPITVRDIYELPELRNQERRIRTAITDINASITTMQRCGVYTPNEISKAYAQAINTKVILSVVIQYMNNLEANLLAQRR